MKFAEYAIARFRPFAETGEFANIGIVAFDHWSGEIDFRLAPARFRRVTQFFSDVDSKLYSGAIRMVERQLTRSRIRSFDASSDENEAQFAFLTKDREALVTFSEKRTVRYGTTFSDLLNSLYSRYIKRDFANAGQREVSMVGEIRRKLQGAHVSGFKAQKIDDELMPVTFPLVSNWRGLHVIKPIAFDQKTTLGIIDHGATWHERFSHLFKRGKLDPNNVLIPIEGPNPDSESHMFEAFQLARQSLGALSVEFLDYSTLDSEQKLHEFAIKGARPNYYLLQ